MLSVFMVTRLVFRLWGEAGVNQDRQLRDMGQLWRSSLGRDGNHIRARMHGTAASSVLVTISPGITLKNNIYEYADA